MAAPQGTGVIYWIDDDQGDQYYDLLGIEGETKIMAIPIPVFNRIMGLPENCLDQEKSLLTQGSYFDWNQRPRLDWESLSENDQMLR